MQTLQFLAEAG